MASVVSENLCAPALDMAQRGVGRTAVGVAEAKLGCTGLVKRYAGREVVAVDALAIQQGETLAVLGPNGAGKSTLFRLLALLEQPDEGAVWLDGAPLSGRSAAVRRKMAAVFQRPLLFQGTVSENVAYGLRFRGIRRRKKRSRVEWGLEMVGLADLREADVRGLSGGELQRIALARALVLEPDILFLDEPTSNLDVHVRRGFREELGELLERLDSTVVLITHDHAEALALSDRVALLRHGRVIQCDRADEVFNRPRNGFAAEFMGVETVWRATVTDCRDGLCTAETSAGVSTQLVGEHSVGEELSLAIRPELVVLSRPGAGDSGAGSGKTTSVRNEWLGVVESVTVTGALARVRIALSSNGGGNEAPAAETLIALITRPSLDDLALEEGTWIVAGVKATALHVLEEEDA